MEDNELISRGTSMESERSYVVGGIRIVVHYTCNILYYYIYKALLECLLVYILYIRIVHNIMIYETWMVGIFS